VSVVRSAVTYDGKPHGTTGERLYGVGGGGSDP